jgi:uncharacterized protein
MTEQLPNQPTPEQIVEGAEAFIRASRLYFEYYRSPSGWRFNLKAGNGEIVTSGEGYRRRKDCLHAIELVKASKDAPVRVKRGKG